MGENEWLRLVTQRDPWDAVVLGGGPAGALAARQLALQGYQVLLVEKSQLPRFKVCGGCLGGPALDVLQDIGLGDLAAKCGGVPLHTMVLASGGSVARFGIGRRMAVSRQTFDAALLREATSAGARVCTETTGLLEAVSKPLSEKGTVHFCSEDSAKGDSPRAILKLLLKHSTDLEARGVVLKHREWACTIRARVVIVATGLSAPPPEFSARTASKSRIGLGAVLENGPGYGEPGTLHMAFGAEGYVGIAPVEEGRLDIAAAVDPVALAAASSPGKLISSIVRDAGLPMLAGVEDAQWRGTPQLTRQTRPLASNRCLLVGDAAGYVEPFTGEGIGWALQSAVLACTLLKGGLDVWDAGLADRWTKLHDRTFGRHQRQCRRIIQVLRSKAMRNVVLWSLRRAPYLARPVVRRLDRLP